MRVRVIVRTCDVPGDRKALFEGQEYDLPADAARELIAAGKAVSTKAVHGPPEDKAVKPAKDKGTCGTCGRKFKSVAIHQRLTGHK